MGISYLVFCSTILVIYDTYDTTMWPIFDVQSLAKAIKLFCQRGDHAVPSTIEVANRAIDLGRTDLLPETWDPWGDMFEEQKKDEDRWWDAALEKQISLRVQKDCKFCRLIENHAMPSPNSVGALVKAPSVIKPWMATTCNGCGKVRLVHRKEHPHKILGNKMALIDVCPGFQEPNYALLKQQLDRIVEVSSE